MSDIDSLTLWYLMRATGATTLLLLTATTALGISATLRWRPAGLPGSASRELHRNLSMLALAFLAVHVLSALTNAHAGVELADILVPGLSGFWLALGTVAVDLLMAIAVTSALRGRIGTPAWKAVHWTAYACWPVAFLHGVGLGTDTTSWWMWIVNAACLLTVIWAITVRVSQPATA